MKALIQRVTRASVTINKDTIGAIENGILLFLGIEKHDDEQSAKKLLEKVSNYRIFSDKNGRMNLNLREVNGDMLVISQFTLVADTRKGLRPSFSSAAPPELGQKLYDYFVSQAAESFPKVETGCFGADMVVELLNDGPVTFLLDV